MKKDIPLRVRVFIATAISSLIPLLMAIIILHFTFINSFEKQIASQAMDIATLAADRVDVKMAYSEESPSEKLQAIATEITNRTEAVFIVFLNMESIRYSHPKDSLIGLKFTGGDEGRALQGESYTSSAVGISGPSIRAFVPIYNLQGEQVGVISVGYWEPDISFILSNIYKTFYLVIPLVIIIIVFFSVFLARSIKDVMFGMEPIEIATLLKERDSMLHSVKEGIIAIDRDNKVTVINQAAQNLFPPNIEFIGKEISELIPDSKLPIVMNTMESQQDQQVVINGSLVLSNRIPLIINDKVMGAIATFRPLTEVNRIAEELTGVNKIVNALRARTHEFLNKLHVISGLIQLESYEEARKYISNLTYKEQSLVSFLVNNIHVNAVSGLLIGKASEAEEKNVELEIDKKSQLFELPTYFNEHAIVVVIGNLIENAFDAVGNKQQDRRVRVLVQQSTDEIILEVEDTGVGIPSNIKEKIFETGFTTKDTGQGYGLANVKNRIEVAGGKICLKTDSLGSNFHVTIPYQMS